MTKKSSGEQMRDDLRMLGVEIPAHMSPISNDDGNDANRAVYKLTNTIAGIVHKLITQISVGAPFGAQTTPVVIGLVAPAVGAAIGRVMADNFDDTDEAAQEYADELAASISTNIVANMHAVRLQRGRG